MWLWLTATAKAHATPQTIAAKRHQWLAQGKEAALASRCRFVKRYVVKGGDAQQVFWLVETDDREALSLITNHFGDLWEIEVREVVPQAIAEAAGA